MSKGSGGTRSESPSRGSCTSSNSVRLPSNFYEGVPQSMHGSLREAAKKVFTMSDAELASLLETHGHLIHGDGNRHTFVVYGDGEDVKQWCREHNCIYVTSIIAIKNKLEAIERMKRNAASFDNDSNLSNG